MNREIGKRIGDYEILGVLGAGGMGQVFKVRNLISDRVEAMKVLLPDLTGRQDLANRFLREIKVLAALNHPNIASLRTALTLDNQFVMVMEYVEGVTLASRLGQGRIPVVEALNYIDQVLNALSYAHKQKVIHRDVKPANMMLTPQGVVKLMDFGIARSGTDRSLTSTGMTLGSLHYMSPEQVRGTAIDGRSDLYSVGVSLYEMVTGKPPFEADSDYSLMAAQLQKQPKPPVELLPQLPPGLNDVILTALQKDPANRFQMADAFRQAVNRVASTLSTLMPSPVRSTSAPAPPAATELYQETLPAAAARITTASVNSATAVEPAQQTTAASRQAVQLTEVVPPHRSTHRGLYMSVGAFAVLAVLVAAGLYIPRHSSTRAHETGNDQPQPPIASQTDRSQSAPPGPPQPSTSNGNQLQSPEPASAGSTGVNPAAAPSPATAGGANPAGPSTVSGMHAMSPSPSIHRKAKQAAAASSMGSEAEAGSSDESAGTSASSNAPAADQQALAADAQLEELETEMDQLSSRAESVNNSLNTLRQQQNAQGYGLRGDISSTQEMMKTNIAKAQMAMQNRDAKNAKRYLDLAQPQVESLERFLGR